MQAVRLHLEEYRQHASSAECDIIDYVLSNFREAAGKSIHELADKTYTSASTVVRLCKKLGCAGYREFQQALVYELAVSDKSNDIAVSGVISGDSTEKVIEKVTSRNIASLELTKQLLEADAIDEGVSLMMEARSICLFGIGASLLVAHDLQLKLMRLNIACNLCDDLHSQLLYAKNTGREDLAIVISYSGLTREMLECAWIVKANGAKLVAITRSGVDSELARRADFVLGVAETEHVLRSGAMSSRIAQLNVIDTLFVAYVNRNYEKSVRRFSSNYIGKSTAPSNKASTTSAPESDTVAADADTATSADTVTGVGAAASANAMTLEGT